MGYSISQEKILTKSKKNNTLTKLHTSHAASTTPPLPLPRGSQWGLFYYQYGIAYASRPAVIKNSGSLPAHRVEITLRGPRSRNIKKRLYRRVEMSDKGKVKKIRCLGYTVTYLKSKM